MKVTTQRTITMTVYAIEAYQYDVGTMADLPGTRYLNGRITVKAHGQGERHEWTIPDGQRCWPGDTVEVTVIEEHELAESTNLTPPPLDKR